MKKVICQEWNEFERGWGQRPDGYTLHSSKEEHQKMINKMKQYEGKEEYSYPTGEPFVAMVDEEEFKEVKENGSLWKPRLYKPKRYDPLEDIDS